MTTPYQVKNKRKMDYPVDQVFLDRWSPRSISSKGFTMRNLMSLFEAARWSASSSNGQPWYFMYEMYGGKDWEKFYGLLNEFNQMWTKDAGALLVLISRKKFLEGGKVDKLNSFGAGSAFMSLALQARMMGLVTHGMAGFNYSKARKVLGVKKGFEIEAMVAVGSQGKIENLHPRMQKNEKPNNRRRVGEFVSRGGFSGKWN
jgi:nitroreductase